jgi:heme-degrading monooxygenase HmoA
MYISMSRLRLPEEHVAELLDAFENRARLVDSAEGFLELEVWHSDREPGEVIMVSRWSTKAAFTMYMKSEDHRTSHGRIAPTLKSVIKLERLDHLHTYDVVAR